MIIDRKIEKYIVFKEDSIARAIEKIDDNEMRVIFVVDESGTLEGILTDGDFRRWVLSQKAVDMGMPVIHAANKDYTYCIFGANAEKIEGFFSQRVDYVPLVDAKMRLIAVASKRIPKIIIGERAVAEDAPAFIIAEIGNNHNGDIKRAKTLVDEAAAAGADCVKFQMRDMKKLYHNEGKADDAGEDLGSQYVLDLLDRFQLSDEELIEIFDYSWSKHVVPLCTPWDEKSVDILDNYGMHAFKIASADFTNHELLSYIAAKGRPMICSTGMSTEQEIRAGVDLLHRLGTHFILLHCNSTYPAPFKDVNLNYLKRLKELSSQPVGYSGHERGIQVAIAAVALGAKVVEKHLTLDRSMEGNDHKVSLLPAEFQQMVEGIRNVENALGTDKNRVVTQGELINRETLAKSLVVNCDVTKGQMITADMIEIKSPGKGLAPYRQSEIVGTPAKRNIAKGSFLYPEDLSAESVQPRNFKFVHPYGVPVRYHDALEIASSVTMDLLEIHLSYKDMEEDIDSFFDRPFEQKLVVHSPELFAGDHILDLCSEDKAYRLKSVELLQKVIEVTNYLKNYFPASNCPPIVTNVGGFSADQFVSPEKKELLYELLLDSLACLNQEGVEILPQTMPPYPWHFGGQRYHNLFVDVEEIVSFCSTHNYRICLDISHSKLACNVSKYSFLEFLQRVAPYTAHMHIADASGVDGEGLQIEEGEIDFHQAMKTLGTLIPNVSFIPEIWQGHKNQGQGFWVALDRLERLAVASG